jgi:hypothetical protein
MAAEISDLAVANRALELQVRSLGAETDLAAPRAIVADMRGQEPISAVRVKLAKERAAVIAAVRSRFDELDQLSDREISDETFMSIIESIAEIYRSQRETSP